MAAIDTPPDRLGPGGDRPHRRQGGAPALIGPAGLAAPRRKPLLGIARTPLLTVGIDLAAIALGIVLTDRPDEATLLYLVLVPLWLALLGSYRTRLNPTLQTDLVPLLGALACPTFVLALVGTPSAMRLVQDTPVIAGVVVALRVSSYALQRAARRLPGGTDPVLVVGAGVLGCRVVEALQQHPEYGLDPIGFIDGFADDAGLPIPVLGDIADLDVLVARHSIRRVIIAFGANREAEIVRILRASAIAAVEVHILPRLFELGVTPSGPDADIVWGFPLQLARRSALRTPAWRTKRVVDVVVSGLVLVLASPVLAAIAVAVKTTSKGPLIFKQQRVGQRGDLVQIYKFRSMRVNDEADTRWGSRQDDRITPVGRLIRATSLDELPQLFNVLKGDMSLVGPRPERAHFADKFDQQVLGYRHRLRVPVGLTGWAQVHGLRGDTSIEERARFDNYYIEHWSLWFDAVILARTVTQVLKESWASLRSHGRR